MTRLLDLFDRLLDLLSAPIFFRAWLRSARWLAGVLAFGIVAEAIAGYRRHLRGLANRTTENSFASSARPPESVPGVGAHITRGP
jgi:hypothetical protein